MLARKTALPPLAPIRNLSGKRATTFANSTSMNGIRPSIDPAIIMRSPRSSRLSGSQEVWSKNKMRRKLERIGDENG